MFRLAPVSALQYFLITLRDPEDLVVKADKAMYLAKDKGKNTVVVSGSE